jgi:hypothetical protein
MVGAALDQHIAGNELGKADIIRPLDMAAEMSRWDTPRPDL